MAGRKRQCYLGARRLYNRIRGVYYWYGENKGRDNRPAKGRLTLSAFRATARPICLIGITEGLALAADTDNEKSMLHTSMVLERPKVLYNEGTNKFVMWFHSDNSDYLFAGVGVAVSDTPKGPFA